MEKRGNGTTILGQPRWDKAFCREHNWAAPRSFPKPYKKPIRLKREGAPPIVPALFQNRILSCSSFGLEGNNGALSQG